MDKHFEKILIILMAMAFISLPFLNHYAQASENGLLPVGSSALVNEYPGITRFHVIANSDSANDQNLKLQVRDYVLGNIQSEIAEELKKDESLSGKNAADSLKSNQIVIKQYIENNLSKIEKWSKEVIDANNMNYEVSASFGVRHIPAKYYGQLLFPEGNYESLTITIGSGRGQNWWCVVLPPLCLIDSSNEQETTEYGFTENDTVQLKFKTQELLQSFSEKNTQNACLNLLSNTISLMPSSENHQLMMILESYTQQY